ncbi:SHC-transforming protein 3-like isoform X2 [Hippocampus zosterae]|uniref:SHC-transforming protein 3-like isoform X2 n=1 Tax=Hippocampus zosterae TaxID=109293 RepID=UPI00223E6162|nr:SHC-transforming protein 3-like isoform X2 [Hippocampus zosterae]
MLSPSCVPSTDFIRTSYNRTLTSPSMLKRTKYSRLHNDSRTSLDNWSLCLDSDFAHDPPRDFVHDVPSHIPPHGLSGPQVAGSIDRYPEWSVPNPPKRPITFHCMCSFPEMPNCLCCPRHKCKQCSSVVHRVVHHHIKYMGSVEVTQSMRTLDFDARKRVTREAINRLCKIIPAKTTVKTKSPEHKQLSCVLGRCNLQFSGRRVIFSVSADTLTLLAASSQRITQHSIQAISFASGGDPDMEDYIAYIAKDQVSHRACHILECPQGRAAEVIHSISWAFESRFKQLLCHAPSFVSADPRSNHRMCNKWIPDDNFMGPKDVDEDDEGENGEHNHDYNVTRGKMPPFGGVEDQWVTRAEKEKVGSATSVSLYENCSITLDTDALTTDPLQSEMRSIHCSLSCGTYIQNLIQEEGWFHGRLRREQAESLLSCDGDFLVRESSSACGQYVLCGMDGSTVRHLLLVDPHGQVRTCDQVFRSVGHLVRFYMRSQIPIMTGSNRLCLKQPILRKH